MKDLNIVDTEMNSDNIVDESEVLVTLDPGGKSGSSTPPLNRNLEPLQKDKEQNASSNNSSSSGDEVTNQSKFPPPPSI